MQRVHEGHRPGHLELAVLGGLADVRDAPAELDVRRAAGEVQVGLLEGAEVLEVERIERRPIKLIGWNYE